MSETITIDIGVLDEIIVGRVEPQIYAFTTETIPNYLKVGDTYRPLETRLNEWRKHFPNLEKKFEAVAKVDDDTFFRDYAVHSFLENVRLRTRLTRDAVDDISYYSIEFFKHATEGDINDAIEDIKTCHENNDPKYQYYKFDESLIPETHTYTRTAAYEPRPNQQETINKFRIAIDNGRNNLLMYAVMRFGKSFTSMCCAVEMNANFVTVVSAKADVREEWKKTVESHVRFEGYSFLDSESLSRNETVISDKLSAEEKIVLFLTLQDLQGKDIKSRHKEVFDSQIDLLLIDETHFGARALEYGKVLKDNGLKTKEIKNEQKLSDNTMDELDDSLKVIDAKVRIHLSGTPYRIIMDSEFTDDDIIAFYQFSDIADDQEMWDNENLNDDENDLNEWDNPYYGFPKMIRFAFNPNQSSRQKMEEMKKYGVTYAFSALFKPQSIIKDGEDNLHKKFEHEEEIIDLLKVIDGSKEDEELLSFLNYDKIKDGKMCRHIVCVLPYRASCDALEELIKSNTFKNLSSYEIINISGVENDRTYKDTPSVQDKIKKCESDDIKTITLTVNKMLTGSTVPQWDTMLYFKDTSSPQEYDQAIFRLQNQYIKTYKEPNGDEVKYNMKPQTLLVDFNPNRMFLIQEQKSQIYNVNTDLNGNTKLEERIRKELEISPIVWLNKNKIVQVEPSDILDKVRKYLNTRSVFDEATTISIDYSLLDVEAIKAVIEKQGRIGSRQGLEIEPTEDEGEDIDTGDKPTEDDELKENVDNNTNPKDDDTKEDFKGQFAMYYARILFFAFLTDSKVKSLQEIIDNVNNNNDNLRIVLNLNLDIEILKLFQEHINPFILRELDYKIQNINSLASDLSLEPEERATIAMNKFSRMSKSEIVTPQNTANMIVDTLPSDAISGTTKIIDMSAKQGEFAYAIYKKFGKDVANNFYSIPTSKIAYEFTRKVYSFLELNINNIEENDISYDLIEENKLIMNEKIKINGDTMKFDAVIGNPPYQLNDGGGTGSSAMPIYQKFVSKAKKMNPEYISMIIPSRWFSGGRGLDEFRNQMLNDNRINVLHDFINASECFPGVEIKGGVCYFLWKRDYEGNCSIFTHNGIDIISSTRPLLEKNSETFIRYNEAISILRKVQKFKAESFSGIISANDPFGFDMREKGSYKRIKPKYRKRFFKESVKFYYNNWKNEGIGYISEANIRKNDDLVDKFKILIPKAWGTGDSYNDRLSPFIVEPKSCCTETYLLVEPSDNKDNLENIVSYINTKFFHFLVSLIKNTQNAMKKVYNFVPIQNFDSDSDIDWNKSIEEIDRQLYKKYSLSDKEIKFIESMIKPMN